MSKPVRVILLDEADAEYKRLNQIVGQQSKEENTEEKQLYDKKFGYKKK